jgi:hypothetical protein
MLPSDRGKLHLPSGGCEWLQILVFTRARTDLLHCAGELHASQVRRRLAAMRKVPDQPARSPIAAEREFMAASPPCPRQGLG